MDQELRDKLDAQVKKIDVMYKSVERLRKYFMWTLIIAVITVVLPVIGLVFVIPYFLHTLSLSSLGL